MHSTISLLVEIRHDPCVKYSWLTRDRSRSGRGLDVDRPIQAEWGFDSPAYGHVDDQLLGRPFRGRGKVRRDQGQSRSRAEPTQGHEESAIEKATADTPGRA